MATETQRTRLRGDIGANDASLPNTEADDIFTEAGESYTETAAVEAYARVIAIRRLLASAAKMATYKQNQSSENVSDVFDHLEKLLDRWEKNLDKATSAGQSVVKFGRPKNIPQRLAEYPNS